MNIYALLSLSFIPLVTVFILFALLVPGQKIKLLFVSVLSGVLSLIPAAFIQLYFGDAEIFNVNTVTNLLVTAIVFNGLFEETSKMVLLNLIPRKKHPLRVFFSCCVLAGFTFGSLESVIYLLKSLQTFEGSDAAGEALKLIFMRMGTTVLIHSACAGLSGLFLWKWKNKNFTIMPFVYAVLLHGIYNFFAFRDSGYKWFSIIAILFAVLECRIFYRSALETQDSEQAQKS